MATSGYSRPEVARVESLRLDRMRFIVIPGPRFAEPVDGVPLSGPCQEAQFPAPVATPATGAFLNTTAYEYTPTPKETP